MTESIKYPDAQQLTVHGRIAFLEELSTKTALLGCQSVHNHQ